MRREERRIFYYSETGKLLHKEVNDWTSIVVLGKCCTSSEIIKASLQFEHQKAFSDGNFHFRHSWLGGAWIKNFCAFTLLIQDRTYCNDEGRLHAFVFFGQFWYGCLEGVWKSEMDKKTFSLKFDGLESLERLLRSGRSKLRGYIVIKKGQQSSRGHTRERRPMFVVIPSSSFLERLLIEGADED